MWSKKRMVIVVNQPLIDNGGIKIEGENIPNKFINYLKRTFGEENISFGEENTDPVLFRDTEWFKNIRGEITPEENVKFYRKQRGMKQKELASLLSTSKSVISDIERGRRKVGKEMAKKLSCVFNVSIEHFI